MSLSGIGGVVGIIFGILSGFLINHLAGFPMTISDFLGDGRLCCIGVGWSGFRSLSGRQGGPAGTRSTLSATNNLQLQADKILFVVFLRGTS